MVWCERLRNPKKVGLFIGAFFLVTIKQTQKDIFPKSTLRLMMCGGVTLVCR